MPVTHLAAGLPPDIPLRAYLFERALKSYVLPYAPKSREAMLGSLKYIALSLGLGPSPYSVPWERLDSTTVSELVSNWSKKFSDNSIRLRLFALHEIIRCCGLQGLSCSISLDEIKRLRTWFSHNPKSRGTYIDAKILLSLLDSCMNDVRLTVAHRDRAMLALLFGAGLRRSETAAARRVDLDFERRTLQVRSSCGEVSIRYIPDWACEEISQWVAASNQYYTCGDCILQRVCKSGSVRGNLTGSGLSQAFKARCALAEVHEFKLSDARHTLATDVLQRHGLTVAKTLLGHKTIASTMRYDSSPSDMSEDSIKIFLSRRI